MSVAKKSPITDQRPRTLTATATVALAVGVLVTVDLLAKTKVHPTSSQAANSDRLHSVVEKGDLKALKGLIEQDGLDVNVLSRDGMGTPLHRACRAGNVAIANYLLKQGADSFSTNNLSRNAPLHVAVIYGKVKVVGLLSSWGAYLDQTNSKGMTALHYAISHNRLDLATLLVDEGADINLKTKQEETSLYFAVSSRSMEMVKWVLSKVGDWQIHQKTWGAGRPELQHTPLNMAFRWGLKEVAMLLIREANEQFEDEDYNKSLVSNAVKGGKVGLVRFLMHKKIPLDFVSADGGNAIHLAVIYNRTKTDMIKFLADNGLRPMMNDRDHAGRVPLYYAILGQKPNLAKALLENGADIRSVGKISGFPASHYVFKAGTVNLARLFAEHNGIDLTLIDAHGKTVLDYAKASKKRKEMMAILEGLLQRKDQK